MQPKILPYQLYRFIKPRADKTASRIVLVADTYITGNKAKDYIIVMDVRHYAEGVQRVFHTIPLQQFTAALQAGDVVEFIPHIKDAEK